MTGLNLPAFFSWVGISVTVILTAYEVYKIYRWEGGFSGKLNSHFKILVNYIFLSGMLFIFFFLTPLLGSSASSLAIGGFPILDIYFLITTLVWMYTAYGIFQNLEEMSENYFVK